MNASAMQAFVLRVHREIRLVPLAEDAEALEIALVRFHVARSILAAHAAKFGGADFRRLAAEFLFHLRLDGQAVAIPPGNIGRAKPGHGLRLHDHVFQDLVEAGAEVNFARRIRRAVVQDEERRSGARIEDAVIEPHLFPGGQLHGLALRQLRFHGKIGLRQVQRALQVQGLRHRGEPSLNAPF